ncbi:oligomeric Golgi complex subunit 7 [Kockovaella imperatae]|uniref:Conserved oligomeric Golgi complex subunit 7 n=1 Tax=Kockovaella imperatae TaxID=4999 RepID=A0A1Y1UGC1_9TREE|nr:oligomeric Golgi complex subunit 7 [Kockovaella imperatae]ORX36105.1 oligomeric Golgi complex subunit 7 [Kockovaella imperatae]
MAFDVVSPEAMSTEQMVDLNNSPPLKPADNPSSDPLSSISSLADFIDAHTDDTASMINELMNPFTSLEELEKALGSLSTRLSLLSSDTSSALEQSIHDISRTVPRLTYDLQFMRESATTLQTSLSIVQSQVARQRLSDDEGDETHKSLEKLAHLDKLKTRMESARGILREAESWSTLEGEITEFFGSESWNKAGTRLAEASKSMVVFQSTPGEYESRRTLLVSLQNELEGKLATALNGSIERGDVEASAKLREVFELIERGVEYQNYYFVAKRKKVVDEWTEATSTTTTFSSFLSKWYASLLATIHTEKTQIPLIFSTPPDKVLTAFLLSSLNHLSPSFESRLSSLADQNGLDTLPELIRCYKATEDFVTSARGILQPASSASLGPRTHTTVLQETPRRPSPTLSRKISSRSATVSSEDPLVVPTEWEAALYDPYLDFQTAYGTLEKRHLSLLSPKAASTSARALTDQTNTMFSILGEATSRCVAFTHGYGAVGLVKAMGEVLERFMDDIQLDPSGTGQTTDELDFEGLDYSTKDWEGFQHGLHILAVCRDLRAKLDTQEGKIHDMLLLCDSQPDSAARALLRQSTLNSIEYASLTADLPLDPPAVQLKTARQALRSFTRRTQSFIQSIILAPLKSLLATYPTLPEWSAPDKVPQRGDLPVPTFSLGPTETIARVSEGLLNLLRVFEVYAADDALGFSIETLPFVDSESTGDLNAEVVLSTWVSSLSISLLAHLTGTILPGIRNLSTSGSAQLASDLGYLSNAVRALDVEWEDLEKWREKIEPKEKEASSLS